LQSITLVRVFGQYARQLRSEIDHEKFRIKAEVPALEAYEHFITILADRSIFKARRPELRQAFAALLEKIVLDPHGKDGVWRYTVHLKGARESVEIVCNQPSNPCHQNQWY
jgi:hypothetical protein